MNRMQATAIGFMAVLLWALLALFTVGSAPTPPLLLNTLAFGIGGIVGLVWAIATKSLDRMRQVPLRVYIFGTLGLFAYHLLYFSALRLAPAAEAGLIAYLWPLLIVIFSGLLPGEQLRAGHIIGAVLGFAGAALIITGGGTRFGSASLTGYLLALMAAFTWGSYSVLSRRVSEAPTAGVAIFCLGTSALSLPLHLFFAIGSLPKSKKQHILPTTLPYWILNSHDPHASNRYRLYGCPALGLTGPFYSWLRTDTAATTQYGGLRDRRGCGAGLGHRDKKP